MKILIVDDERDVLELFKDLFKDKYEVETTQNGKIAMEMIYKNRPEVVLLDIKMAEMDGITVLQEIKKRDPSIEVVMLTAYGYDDKLINECIEKGAAGYISKNLPLKQIVNTFKTLLSSMSL